MASNPYETPTEIGAGAPQPFPTTAMVISIICLIFGILGLFGVCMGGVSLAFISSIAERMPGEVKQNIEQTMNLQFVPAVIQIVIGVIAAPLMVVASIGCLTRKDWGRSLLIVAAIGFILWNVVGVVSTLWMLMFHFDLLVSANQGPVDKEMARMIVIGQQVFTILFALAFAAFYAFAAAYMSRQSTKDFFAGASAVK